MEQKELKAGKQKISYRIKGTGNTVVLLHGFGENGLIWENQFNALEGFQLIIPELPGTGSSIIEDMSMEGQAKWLKSFLDQLKIKNLVLVGHSMGGYITLAFAEKYPDMLKGFGLCSSTAYADTEEKKETRRKGIEFIRRHGPFELMKISTPNLYAPVTRQQNSSLVSHHIELTRNFQADVQISYYEAMIKRPDRTKVLMDARVPVLFILGKHDNAVPFQDGLQQCHLPPVSDVVILENSGHMGMIEEAAKTNEHLRSFVTECFH